MTLSYAEEEARRARAAFSKLEAQAIAARENGTKMSPDWWAHFGDAYAAVQVAERAVHRAREAEAKR